MCQVGASLPTPKNVLKQSDHVFAQPAEEHNRQNHQDPFVHSVRSDLVVERDHRDDYRYGHCSQIFVWGRLRGFDGHARFRFFRFVVVGVNVDNPSLPAVERV